MRVQRPDLQPFTSAIEYPYAYHALIASIIRYYPLHVTRHTGEPFPLRGGSLSVTRCAILQPRASSFS